MEPTRRELLTGLSAGLMVGCAGDGTSGVRPTGASLFVGHGSPMLAIDPALGAPYRALGEALGKPRAVLAVSAHWEAPFSIGGVEAFPIEHDFVGFPEELQTYRYSYRAAPWLAERIAALAMPTVGAVGWDELRNFDHGVWTPIVNMFPDGDVPILQCSLPSELGPEGVFAVGRALAPLRADGVVIMASGNLTHAIGTPSTPGAAPESWAEEFDAWATEAVLARDWDTLIDAPRKAPAYKTNHPSDDHWLPILFAAGAASPWKEDVSFPVEGFEGQNNSRRAVRWG